VRHKNLQTGKFKFWKKYFLLRRIYQLNKNHNSSWKFNRVGTSKVINIKILSINQRVLAKFTRKYEHILITRNVWKNCWKLRKTNLKGWWIPLSYSDDNNIKSGTNNDVSVGYLKPILSDI
jgi:hypothetical protein